MYYVSKRMEISACHHLTLDYPSKCTQMHGHNWIFTVYCKAEKLNKSGMVVDFSRIKEAIHGRMDHQNLNDILDFNTTAENLAHWVVEQFPECYKASVQETEGNVAVYVDDRLVDGKEAL